MTEQTKVAVDNGNATVSGDTEAADNRHKAIGFAKAIADATMKAETAINLTAKQWGTAMFRSVFNDNVPLDILISESKLASGFKKLGTSEPERKLKQRLNTYFSNARTVMENWLQFSEEQRQAVLDGETSIHTLAGNIRDADRKIAAEAKKAEAAAEAAASGTVVETATGSTLKEDAEALLMRFNAASDEERNEAYDAIGALVDAMNAAIEAGAVEPSDNEGEAEPEKLAA